MRICAPGKTAFTLEQTHVLIVCLRVVLISILLLGTSHSALRVNIVPEKISIKKSPLPKAKAIKIVRKNRSREIRPLNIAELPFYSFASVDRAFGRVDISRIPEFTGNKNLIYYSECDSCNNKFSKYERDLFLFGGIKNIISGTKGKKYPKHIDKEPHYLIPPLFSLCLFLSKSILPIFFFSILI